MSNLSGISEYLNLAEVKESVREGADSVKKLMKKQKYRCIQEMNGSLFQQRHRKKNK